MTTRFVKIHDKYYNINNIEAFPFVDKLIEIVNNFKSTRKITIEFFMRDIKKYDLNIYLCNSDGGFIIDSFDTRFKRITSKVINDSNVHNGYTDMNIWEEKKEIIEILDSLKVVIDDILGVG